MKVSEVTHSFEKQIKELNQKELDLEEQLDKAHEAHLCALKEAQEAREAQRQAQEQLASCRGRDEVNSSQFAIQLSEKEEERRSLESRLHRLEILQGREELLQQEVSAKGAQIVQLADRVAELNDLVERLRSEKLEADEKSLYVFEQNEDHLKKLHEYEAVSACCIPPSFGQRSFPHLVVVLCFS